ncbi:MFS transporter [Yersinia enterocolitica]|uniref:MFS transporter n=1 Tax=Yersinia enterocolitica TaxID=630 RepID=UPI0030A60142|nr:MFS transporter [Yersinia enterocolitica]EKN6081423.1 MFS transporter [Yersinia enterocolitica]EKN6153983.1 MFS transporter [Yersinia enterocolitica]
MNKTPYCRLLLAINLGVGTSLAPITLLIYGLSQFNIIRLVGKAQATETFGLIVGIVSIAAFFLMPCGGYLSDKTKSSLGRRRFWIIFGSIAGSIAMLFFAYSTTLFQLAIAWIAIKFFYGVVTVTCLALIPEQVDISHYGRVSGLISVSSPFCIMLMTMIIMGYFSDVNVQYKIIMIAIVQLICALVAALLIKDPLMVGSTTEPIFTKRYFYPSFKKYPAFSWAFLTKLSINLTSAGLVMMPLFYISRFKLEEKQVFELSALMSSGIIILIASGLLGGYLSDRIRKQKIFIIFSAVMISISMCIFAFSTSLTMIILGQLLLLLGMGLFNAVDTALINRILPSQDNYAKDISIINLTHHIATSLMSFSAPYLIFLGVTILNDDGYTLFFLTLAVFSLLTVLAVIHIPEIVKRN